jgi:hypothetical protein
MRTDHDPTTSRRALLDVKPGDSDVATGGLKRIERVDTVDYKRADFRQHTRVTPHAMRRAR